jgi:hypothetical protein
MLLVNMVLALWFHLSCIPPAHENVFLIFIPAPDCVRSYIKLIHGLWEQQTCANINADRKNNETLFIALLLKI